MSVFPALVNVGTKLSIVETIAGIAVPALFIMPVSSAEAAYNVLFEAMSNRVVAEHNLNRRSSRSHVIYTFYLTASSADPPSPAKRTKNKNRSLFT